jgi:hypothetical protein
MIVMRLPTTLCVRPGSRGVQEERLLAPHFSPSTFLSPWEPRHEQTD